MLPGLAATIGASAARTQCRWLRVAKSRGKAGDSAGTHRGDTARRAADSRYLFTDRVTAQASG